ncbi:MAG: CCA tRNA nucleotidyltransferase [Nanoarchaeota archaeon]|nr:CCA tRNA nucleotidyltransferase [Nanoarchaeota archaeon]
MKILKEITPTEFEKKKAFSKINSFLSNLNFRDAKLELGGSFAKDTWLKNNFDVDVFVRFPYDKYKTKDISKILQNRLKKAKVVHGSRDYFQIKKKKFIYEFIPVLDIKHAKDAKNITDVSPLHMIWVKKHEGYSNQIRLAKKFCKANGLYGAESHIRGFSGYVLEVLIIYYKSFMDFVKAACDWKEGDVIDVEKHYLNNKDVLEKLNKDKYSPLVVIDPVDKNRNAAASLSKEKFEKFIGLCRKFMRNPSDEFFKDKKIDIKELKLKSNGNKFVLFNIKLLQGKRDIVGGKVLKVFAYIGKKIQEADFKLIDSNWNFESKLLWYYVKNEHLSEYKKHYGPPIKEEKHLELFKKKWKGYELYDDSTRVFVRVKRKYKEIKGFIKELVKNDYIKENVKGIRFRVY